MSYIKVPMLDIFENIGEQRMIHLKRKPCGRICVLEFLPDTSFGRQFTFESMDKVNIPEDVYSFVINYETKIEVEDLDNNNFKIKE